MNVFALSCIITAVFTAIMCFVVLLNNFKDKTNRAWFWACFSIFIWTVGLSGTILVNNVENALFWQRILYIGTILIPIFFFYFCLNLLGREENNKKSLFIGFFLSIFFIVLSFSKFFIIGVKERTDFGYWPVQTGSFYFLFLLYFAFYVIYSVVLLKIDSKKHDGVYQKQIQYVYYAALIGFVGGSTNFLLDFNLNTYSIGNYVVIFYIIFISYAVFKHHLFDLKVIATELFTFALWITLFIKIFISANSKDLILNIGILSSSVVIGVLLIRSVIKEVKQREKIELAEKEVKRALDAEKKANNSLELFMTGLQHDIKGYLTPILSGSSSLIDGSGAFSKFVKGGIQLNENGINMIKIFEKSAIAARDQSDDFMAIAKFRQGKPILSLDSVVELSSILEELVSSLEPQAELGGIALEFERPNEEFVIFADQVKLKSALRNVIGNSIKYTKKGKVTIKVTKKDGDKILIEVKDTGIGIPSDKIATLFSSPFERTAEARKTAGGSGFGLYFASLIIGLHNGKIWVESGGEGKGSVFYIELATKKDEKDSINKDGEAKINEAPVLVTPTEKNKKDYDLWYRDIGRDWIDAHDDKGNLIKKDYWEKTDKINNDKYQRDLEQN